MEKVFAPNAKRTEKHILEAQLAISVAQKHPKFKTMLATVYPHPLSMGSSSNAHNGGNAKTYMNVGLGMDNTMDDLLELEK